MNRLRGLSLAAVGLCAAGLLSTGPTLAAPTPEDGSWLTVSGPVPLFDLAALTPGDAGEADLVITNEMPAAARFSLRVVELRSDDFGCSEPEADAGDTSCGQDEGELDDALQLTLREIGADGAASSPLRTDVLSAWATTGLEDAAALGASEQRTYSLSYELPATSTNVVQSDRVSFAVELRLDQANGAEVEGTSFGSGTKARIDAAPQLPRTGNELLGLIRLGAGSIAIGCTALLLVGRRRERALLAAVRVVDD
jgi:hypothetical protein